MTFMNRYRKPLSVLTLALFAAAICPAPTRGEYNPQLGRFMQRDPNGMGLIVTPGLNYQGSNPTVTVSMAYTLQYGDGMNFYEYLRSNPVNRTDPTGQFALLSTLNDAALRAYIGFSMFAAAHRTAMTVVGGVLAAANLYAFVQFQEVQAIVMAQPNPAGLLAGEAALARQAFREVVRRGPSLAGLARAEEATQAAVATATAVTRSSYESATGAAEALVPRSQWPKYATRVEAAHANGYPVVLTIDRAGAPARRATALRGIPKVPGMDLDEYPPAMFKEGGAGASVVPIPVGENRAAGASIARQLENLPDGTKVVFRVVP